MKMDIDCIRDILLQAEIGSFTIYDYEDYSSENNYIHFLEKYDKEKLFYHIDLANELGLIKVSLCIGSSTVLDLSAQGHLLLADIREENIWNKTKEISTKLGINSLNAIKEIATNVISNLITNYFQR